jgi:hypothetical protein
MDYGELIVDDYDVQYSCLAQGYAFIYKICFRIKTTAYTITITVIPYQGFINDRFTGCGSGCMLWHFTCTLSSHMILVFEALRRLHYLRSD